MAGATVLIWARRLSGERQSTRWLQRGTEQRKDRTAEAKPRDRWETNDEGEGEGEGERERAGKDLNEDSEETNRDLEEALRSEEAAEVEVVIYMTMARYVYVLDHAFTQNGKAKKRDKDLVQSLRWIWLLVGWWQ